MKKRIKTGFPAILAIALIQFPLASVRAADIDFSCMSYKVWGKDHVSAHFRVYDVVLQNRCPGPVLWSMCIERVDPWTNKIVETHNPAGYIEAEKKARVNLQLKKSKRKSQFRNRYQEFYVSIGYAIELPVSSECFARECESKKRELRAQIRANESAWEGAERTLSAKLDSECTGTVWDTAASKECEARVRESSQAEIALFATKDEELREKMAAIDPERCALWSGELIGN